MAYSLTIGLALGSSMTGLTLRANLKDTSGTPVGGNVTTGFVELGAGNYEFTGTIPDGFQGSVVFADNVTTTVLAAAPINQADAPRPDDFTATMKTSLNAATPAAVTGNVNGKVLGGGAGTITGVGAWAADSGGATFTYAAPLNAAGVRTAVGLGSANLDTQFSGITGTLATVTDKTNLIPAVPSSVGSAMTLAAGAISDGSFTVTADPSTVPTGPVGWWQALAARFGIIRRVKVDKLAGTIEVYRANGSTVWFTNVYSASVDVEDVSAAV